MLTLGCLKAAARKVGATVEEDDGNGRREGVDVVAPDGEMWSDGGCVCLVVLWDEGDRQDKQDALKDAIERIECGLEPFNEWI